MHAGQGKNRFTVVSTQNKSLFLYYYLLIIVLVSIRTTVNILLPYPVNTIEYYSAVKKSEILLSAAWVELQGIILSEISQTENDKYHMVSLTYGI